MITPADIKLKFAEFNSLDDSFIQLHIDSATLNANADLFLSGQNHALLYLTAHFLKISQGNGNSGNISSEKIGDLDRKYSSVNTDISSLNATSYGQEYRRFLKTTLPTPLIF